jgi:hypothetical protein
LIIMTDSIEFARARRSRQSPGRHDQDRQRRKPVSNEDIATFVVEFANTAGSKAAESARKGHAGPSKMTDLKTIILHGRPW